MLNTEKLHIWGDSWPHVGENRIGEVFEDSLRIYKFTTA